MKVKSCRLCLAVDVKVFKLGNTEAKLFLQNIFSANGLKLTLNESHYICYVCNALLGRLNKFIERVLAAQRILVSMVSDKKQISYVALKGIGSQIGIGGNSSILTIDVMKNIDIYPTDLDVVVKEFDSNIVKHEIEIHSYDDDTEMACKQRSNDEMKQKEIEYEQIAVKTEINNGNKHDPLFSVKQHKDLRKRRKSLKRKKTQNNTKGTKTHTKHYKKTLQPSKFILSLPNIGDRKERRANIQYKFADDNDSSETSESETKKKDKEFTLEHESTEETSDSDYDMYDDDGNKIKKPKEQREYPRKCEHCDYVVQKASNHYKHYQFEHIEKPYPYPITHNNYVCQFCGKISTRKALHESHEQTHSNDKPFQCCECPKRFHSNLRLRCHVLTTHTKVLLECDFCSKKFKTRTDIRRHLRIHLGEKPFKCHICGAGFAHSGNVGVHIRSNHGTSDPHVTVKKTKSKPKRKRKSSRDDSSMNLLQGTSDPHVTVKKTKSKPKRKRKSSSDDSSMNLLQGTSDPHVTVKKTKSKPKRKRKSSSDDSSMNLLQYKKKYLNVERK